MEAAPTRDEYDRMHTEFAGLQGWTSLDIQPRWHDEDALASSAKGAEPKPYGDSFDDEFEAVASGGGNSRTSVALNSYHQPDPFNDVINRTAHMSEPLRGDRRSLVWEQAMQNKRKEIAATFADPSTCLESYGSFTQAAVDEAGLNMRTTLASLTPLDLDDVRFRPRSDREEHQAETRQQFEASATSQLGRTSYGNFGM